MTAIFDVLGRIESEINAMDMAKFHSMLDSLMAQRLSAIRVLGFILGAGVGAFQCVAKLGATP